jgi:hypothetical protein
MSITLRYYPSVTKLKTRKTKKLTVIPTIYSDHFDDAQSKPFWTIHILDLSGIPKVNSV